MKILMVCLGNICRSPLAEGILAKLIEEKGLNWHVDSAGTSGWHAGDPPDPRSIEVARQNGIDISHQRSRKFSAYDLEVYNKIYAMDSANLQDILRHCKGASEEEKVSLILNENAPGENQQVPDPYFGEFGFAGVFNMLTEACNSIVKKYG